MEKRPNPALGEVTAQPKEVGLGERANSWHGAGDMCLTMMENTIMDNFFCYLPQDGGVWLTDTVH